MRENNTLVEGSGSFVNMCIYKIFHSASCSMACTHIGYMRVL